LQLKMKMRRQLIERPQLNLNQRQRLLVFNVAVVFVFVASCSFARGKTTNKKNNKKSTTWHTPATVHGFRVAVLVGSPLFVVVKAAPTTTNAISTRGEQQQSRHSYTTTSAHSHTKQQTYVHSKESLFVLHLSLALALALSFSLFVCLLMMFFCVLARISYFRVYF